MTMPSLPVLSRDVRESLEHLRDEIQETLDRWRHRLSHEEEEGQGRDLQPATRAIYRGPALDVEETDDSIIVRAELPGLQPDDFTVEVMANRLILRGEKREERDDQGQGFARMERRYGSFRRVISLPAEVDPDKANAQYQNGVLTVELPKTETSKPRRVKVAAAE